MTAAPDLARLIDHTLLKPEATAAEVRALVVEARELGTYSVCVSPTMVRIAAEAIGDLEAGEAEGAGRLLLAAVAGFPSGAHAPAVKAAEAAQAVADGADEVDMVINLGCRDLGLDRFRHTVLAEVQAVRSAIPGTVLKVIIESAVLSDEEIVVACEASEAAGADFVKTSTGFHSAGGASVHAVALMRATVGDRLGVKASGGIRDRSAAETMVAAGASRLGLSSSRAILAGSASTSAY